MAVYDVINYEKPTYLFDKSQRKAINHDRSNLFYLQPDNKLKVGLNCITNRSIKLMKEFKAADIQLNKDHFHKLCKEKFLNPALH